jgi:hypothetical protein
MGMFDSQGGPDFSLAGMILGGRGYAANWFQQRDQMMWAEAAQAKQDALEKQQAADMMAGPQYKAFRDQPNSRQAALDFWAGSRGMAGATDDQAASYVGQSLGAQYNRMQSTLNAQQQHEAQSYAHSLNLSETDYRTQKELDLYNAKAASDKQRQDALISDLMQTPTEQNTNMAFRAKGFDLPQDKSVKFGADGGMYLVPATGSADHVKMMTQLNAGETMIDTLSDMSTTLESGRANVEQWNTNVAFMQMQAKAMFESGAIDKDSLAIINNMIPSVSRIPDPGARARALEQLRTTILQLKQRNADVISNYSTPLGDLPKGKGDQKYFPTPRGEPPAEGSVTRAQKQIETQPAMPPPDYGKQYDPSSPGSVFQ